ncbi:uncharacterized protein LOC121390437 [Gigantopelta aegis]|uniref:uncharacterized protein LOC121390437 n=1 Tax=Gigantopelta aegis TaxID=1735272 RepID=UPI001B88BDF7|nr:uncharacterized protein LOC121390437 [Gigantopelta aegis]
MTMLLFVIIVAIYGITVKGECSEAEYQWSLETCTEITTNSGVSKDLKDMTDEERWAVCSNYLERVWCVHGILNVCENSPQLMFRGNSLDEMKALVEDQRKDLQKFCGRAHD